jgi:hypothetical protein
MPASTSGISSRRTPHLANRLLLVAAAWAVLGCKPKDEPAKPPAAPAADAAPIGEITSTAVDARLEACKVKMTAPESHEWTTYWDPKGIAPTGEGPSSTHSIYWANASEKDSLTSKNAAIPLDINCSSDEAPEIAISLAAFSSSAKDVPLAPGTYRIVGKATGSVRPGQFLAGALKFNKRMFDATGGTLKIDDFDTSGVRGSFTIDGKEILARGAPLHIEGTFEIPCRGGMLESDCKANKAVARE